MEDKKYVPVDPEIMEKLEALYYTYRSKQDIITSIIDLHQFDEDSGIISSKPFLAYEKQFEEAKVQYDYMMDLITKQYIPEEYKTARYHWEADFENHQLIISA